MKIDVLLFTQTMYSLLKSHLSLQDSIKICSDILTEVNEKKIVENIHKKVNKGKKLSQTLKEYKNYFSSFYSALVSVGEESGTLAEVFGHLSVYIKNKKNLQKKIIQALMYPVMVLFTAVVVVFTLIIFVMPRLREVFKVFSETSENIAFQMDRITGNFIIAGIMAVILFLVIFLALVLRKINSRVSFIIDSIMIKIPLLRKIILTMQMNDFSFSMKLLSQTHFPLVDSLMQAGEVLGSRCVKNAVVSVCKKITNGYGAGSAFESEKIFPRYITVWVKVAEENGNTAEAFSQISDYYQTESDNLLNTITQAAEPVFILITGAIITGVIIQFVLPVFSLLGEL